MYIPELHYSPLLSELIKGTQLVMHILWLIQDTSRVWAVSYVVILGFGQALIDCYGLHLKL